VLMEPPDLVLKNLKYISCFCPFKFQNCREEVDAMLGNNLDSQRKAYICIEVIFHPTPVRKEQSFKIFLTFFSCMYNTL
jgi:hypothetical protein